MLVLNKKDNPTNPGLVYIGRGSNYGNPFPMQKYRNDRNIVVELFINFFIYSLTTNRDFKAEIEKLSTFNNLVCHCAPERCHGDVIKEFVLLQEEYGQKEALEQFKKKKHYTHLPLLDGVDHINIYSKSHSNLGKMLSHFYDSSFEHPKFGKFRSVEAFWFYVGTGMKHEFLRDMWGYNAKVAGTALEKVNDDNFLTYVEEANECKIRQNPSILKEFMENTKPFLHYYSYGLPHNAVVRNLDPTLSKMMNNIATRLKPSFKTIIAGSRDFCDLKLLRNTLANVPWNISTIVDGGAKGADLLGFVFAKEFGIPVETYEADWETHGKSAGYIRNKEMEKQAEKAIVFVKNKSKGSVDMIAQMKAVNKEVLVVEC